MRTPSGVVRPVCRQEPFKIWGIGRTRVAPWSYFINRVCRAAKAEALLEIYYRRNLIALPAAGQPPAWVGVEKNSPTFPQVLFNNRHQIVPGPTTSCTNRFPGACSYCLPVGNRNSL